MSIVKIKDKRNGVTYVYEQDKSYRDPVTKQPRSKRRLIGKLDEKTGEIIPTKGWGKNRGNVKASGAFDWKTICKQQEGEINRLKAKIAKLELELSLLRAKQNK